MTGKLEHVNHDYSSQPETQCWNTSAIHWEHNLLSTRIITVSVGPWRISRNKYLLWRGRISSEPNTSNPLSAVDWGLIPQKHSEEISNKGNYTYYAIQFEGLIKIHLYFIVLYPQWGIISIMKRWLIAYT